jgi:hypothetical protein
MVPDKQYNFLILINRLLMVGSSERAFVQNKQAVPINDSQHCFSYFRNRKTKHVI